jgi:beta-glucosidase
LPVTFYRDAGQLPPFKEYAMAGRTYRYFAGDPLYRFGHGLSYTRFAYGTPRLARSRIRAGDGATLTVRVTNAGAVAGDEVVQLYGAQAAPGAPLRALMGFRRIHLKPGESRDVALSIDPRAMSIVDPAGRRRVAPGVVDLWVGGGQPPAAGAGKAAPGAAARLTIAGTRALD